MFRGLLNVASLPLEIPYTGVREIKKHSKAWPVTYIPRLFSNMAYRFASGANDFFIYPWVAHWEEDMRPLTERVGLSDYVWQQEADKF